MVRYDDAIFDPSTKPSPENHLAAAAKLSPFTNNGGVTSPDLHHPSASGAPNGTSSIKKPPSWEVVSGYLPGYTGHCPGLRENYGLTYGEATRKLLRQRRSQSAPAARFRNQKLTTFDTARTTEPTKIRSVQLTSNNLGSGVTNTNTNGWCNRQQYSSTVTKKLVSTTTKEVTTRNKVYSSPTQERREVIDVENETQCMLVKSTSTNGISNGVRVDGAQNYTPYRRTSSGQLLNGYSAGQHRPKTGFVKDAILGYTGYVPGMYLKFGETYGKASRECKEALVKRKEQQDKEEEERKAGVEQRRHFLQSVTSTCHSPTLSPPLLSPTDPVRRGLMPQRNNSAQVNKAKNMASKVGENGYLARRRTPSGEIKSSVSDTACNYGCCRTSRVLELVRSNEARFASLNHLPGKTTPPRFNSAAPRRKSSLSRPPSPTASPLEGIIDPITGYTGHIPNLAFVTGKPYCVAKEECLERLQQKLKAKSNSQLSTSRTMAKSTPSLVAVATRGMKTVEVERSK